MKPLTELLLASVGAGLAYTVGAHLLASAGVGTIHRGSDGRRTVALTFDDGPDPIFTPRILSILARFDARATFFLIGERAEQYPEIVRAIVDDGHEVGNHTYRHSRLWLLSPARTRYEMDRCANLLAGETGRPPRYFRPPWGKFNLEAYRHAARLNELRILWSLRPEGWRRMASPKEIVQGVGAGLHPGAIINLHDGDGISGAPQRTVQALPGLLELLRAHGYRCVSLSELLADAHGSRVPRGALERFWEWYERSWASSHRLEPITDDGVMALGVIAHQGPPVLLRDGTEVRAGESVGEFHVRRERIIHLHREFSSREVGFALRREMKQALRVLATMVDDHPRYRHLRAYNFTTLYWRTAKAWLGFDPRPIGSPWRRWLLGWYQRMVLARDHPLGPRRLQLTVWEPRTVWLSREELVRRYATGREGIAEGT